MKQNTSPAAQSEHNWRIEKRNSAFLTFLLIAFIVFSLFTSTSQTDTDMLVWEDDHMILSFSEAETYLVFYDQITNLSLVENPIFGICISGSNGQDIRYGQWQNDTLGAYVLYASQSFDLVIQIDTIDRSYWISIESKETTEALYEHMLEIAAIKSRLS